MWDAINDHLEPGRVHRTVVVRAGKPLRYREVAELWKTSADFRAYFCGLLAAAPFPAYAWETPPVTQATLDREFEFVLVDDPRLASEHADAEPFRDVFESDPDEQVVTFPNLGRDALLIAPSPGRARHSYAHLAAFSRTAPDSIQDALWTQVGATLVRHVRDQPVWLSTAGLGVAWLHVRLDSRPKYYRFEPYRALPAST